jgi:hypothetical protein
MIVFEINTQPFKFKSEGGKNFIEIDEKFVVSQKQEQLRKIKLKHLHKAQMAKHKRELAQKKRRRRKRRRTSNAVNL